MATLFQPNGLTSTISPANGKSFALDELQQLVAGYVEFVRVNEQGWLVMNENGKINNLPVNHKASKTFDHALYGTVVLCAVGEIE